MQTTLNFHFAPAGWIVALLSARATPHRIAITPAPGHRQVLQKGAILKLASPIGVEVQCLKGSVWLTNDGDVKDTVLATGECAIIDRDSRLLVQALAFSEVRIVYPRMMH